MRNLTIALMIAVFGLVVMSNTARADTQVTMPFNLTEWADWAGVFAHLNVAKTTDAAVDPGAPIGAGSSVSGDQWIIFNGIVKEVGLSLPGAGPVKGDLFLTPDHGLTKWVAVQEPMKGYVVYLPDLPVGRITTIECGVTTHDKKNRIIPFSWTTDRRLAMAVDIMVQVAPDDVSHLTVKGCYQNTGGLIPADRSFEEAE